MPDDFKQSADEKAALNSAEIGIAKVAINKMSVKLTEYEETIVKIRKWAKLQKIATEVINEEQASMRDELRAIRDEMNSFKGSVAEQLKRSEKENGIHPEGEEQTS